MSTPFYIPTRNMNSNFSTFLPTPIIFFIFEKTIALLVGTINIFLLGLHLWFFLLPGRINPLFHLALTRIYNTVITRIPVLETAGARYYAKYFTCVSSLNLHTIFYEVSFIICILQMRDQAERVNYLKSHAYKSESWDLNSWACATPEPILLTLRLSINGSY